jgi:NAD(P)-dependent dehydrogenase (short-subunit alcohol dehydrogenase family)
MKDALMKKIALVTGTSSGIGLSTAVLLGKAGFTTVATLRDLSRAKTLQERARSEGVTLDLRALDVCSQGSVDACVAQVREQYGAIDVLVNNAGAGIIGTVEQLPVEAVQANFDVNFFGVWRMTRAVIPAMRAARSGRIITVASLGGVVALPFSEAYSASKFAVEGMMESLAPVMARFGVHVSIIEPGAVNTGFLAARNATEEKRKASQIDDPYAELLEAYQRSVNARFTGGQSADEVAAVIVEAATAEAPHLRYQTSDYARGVATQVRRDPDGDALVKLVGAQLDG